MNKQELEVWLYNLCKKHNIIISDVTVDCIDGKIHIKGNRQLILK